MQCLALWKVWTCRYWSTYVHLLHKGSVTMRVLAGLHLPLLWFHSVSNIWLGMRDGRICRVFLWLMPPFLSSLVLILVVKRSSANTAPFSILVAIGERKDDTGVKSLSWRRRFNLPALPQFPCDLGKVQVSYQERNRWTITWRKNAHCSPVTGSSGCCPHRCHDPHSHWVLIRALFLWGSHW